MVSVDFNKNWWGKDYAWPESGDEWSAPWGGAEAQWYGSLFPRIHRYLPAGEVVEIACGFGRWTQFLKDHSGHLTGVDISKVCVDACTERFKDEPNVDFVENDGTTFPGIADKSVDFIFSFDSLVHADQGTLTGYMAEFRRVLKPEGVAFIHHSNLGAYARRYAPLRKVPKLLTGLRKARIIDFDHMRDPFVSAESVAAAAKGAGLRCIGQETTTWLGRRTLIDCISVIVPDESPAKQPNHVVKNRTFQSEPKYVSQLASVYLPE
jgi:SAM-dependent methyltransferase